MPAPWIAIDFGTTRTKLAYRGSNGETRLMRLGLDDKPFIPSLFYVGDVGNRLYGDQAADMLQDHPEAIVDTLKRKLRQTKIRVNRQSVEPLELLVLLIRGLRERAATEIPDFMDDSPEEIVLTIPAMYGPPDRFIMEEAARKAGFGKIRLLPEPVAAARAWLSEIRGEDETVVVLDAGGGTLDWACLSRKGDDYELIADCPPGGDNNIGGHDVDIEILDLLRDRMIDDDGAIEDLQARPTYYTEQIRLMKERFCRTQSLSPLRVNGKKIEISGEDLKGIFERRFIRQACQGFQDYMQRVKEVSRGSSPSVLMVGGSGNIVGLRESIEKTCGCKVFSWDRAEFATVLGGVAIGGVDFKKKPVAPLDARKTNAENVQPAGNVGVSEKTRKEILFSIYALIHSILNGPEGLLELKFQSLEGMKNRIDKISECLELMRAYYIKNEFPQFISSVLGDYVNLLGIISEFSNRLYNQISSILKTEDKESEIWRIVSSSDPDDNLKKLMNFYSDEKSNVGVVYSEDASIIKKRSTIISKLINMSMDMKEKFWISATEFNLIGIQEEYEQIDRCIKSKSAKKLLDIIEKASIDRPMDPFVYLNYAEKIQHIGFEGVEVTNIVRKIEESISMIPQDQAFDSFRFHGYWDAGQTAYFSVIYREDRSEGNYCAYLEKDELAKYAMECFEKSINYEAATYVDLAEQKCCLAHAYLLSGNAEKAKEVLEPILNNNNFVTGREDAGAIYYLGSIIESCHGVSYPKSLEYLKKSFKFGYNDILHVKNTKYLEGLRNNMASKFNDLTSIKCHWSIDFCLFEDDILIFNDSKFIITNVNFKYKLSGKDGFSKSGKLTIDGIDKESSFLWSDVFTVPGDIVNGATGSIQCDQFDGEVDCPYMKKS